MALALLQHGLLERLTARTLEPEDKRFIEVIGGAAGLKLGRGSGPLIECGLRFDPQLRPQDMLLTLGWYWDG